MKQEQLRELILEWQEPIYNLARRMLGNDADAADGTQEVFFAILRKIDHYDPARPFRPWLYQVARNVLLNLIRDRQRAQSKEKAVAMRSVSDANESRECSELREVIETQLGQMSGADRSLLLLHYYHDVTQVELASVLELPRTTVQSRLQKCLATLREKLRRHGYALPAAAVIGAMQSAPAAAVPPTLSAALLENALITTNSSAAVGLGFTLGDLAMKKVLVAVAVVLCLSAGSTGWVIGKGSASAGQKSAGERDRAAGIDRSELQRTVLALEERVAALQRERDALRAQAAHATRAASVQTDSELSESVAASVATGEPAESNAMSWDKFASLFATHYSDLATMVEGGPQSLGAAEQSKLFEAAGEFMRMAGMARQASNYPLFDEEILLGLTGALFEQSLGLSAEQARHLQAAARDELRDLSRDVELSDLTPIELSSLREELLLGVQSSAEGLLDEDQRERWQQLSVAVDHLLAGNRATKTRRIDDWSPQQFEDFVTSEWRQAFGLDDEQLPLVRPLTGDWLRQLDNFFTSGTAVAAMDSTSSEYRAAQQEMQVAVERQLLAYLSGDQLDTIPNAIPTILIFVKGTGGDTSSVVRGPGF
ncbi:MAG: sigma-70 family RNA polymerase sigma factor [Planctomycetota bacterium]